MTLALNLIGILLSVAALSTSTVLLIRQTVFMRHANEISVSVTMYQEYRSAEFQAAQDYVLYSLAGSFDPAMGLSHLPSEARVPSSKVAAYYNSLGTLVTLGLVDERFAVSLLGIGANRTWNTLEPYIFKEREIRVDRDVWAFYEDFVCRARENLPLANSYGLKFKRVASGKPSAHGAEKAMGRSARERAFVNRVVNPVVVALIMRGLGPTTYAVVETTGRKSGRRRPVPVANGLDGDTFWMISGRGAKASFVRNIEADPRVRVTARPARLRDGLRTRSRSGTARLMPDDDANVRHRLLGRGRPLYRLDGIILRQLANGGDMLTIRIDLD